MNIGTQLAIDNLMVRTFTLIFACLFTAAIYGEPASEIHNWDKLTSAQQIKATALVTSIYSNDAEVLDEFKITMNMTYYSTDLKVKYKGEYSNNKKSTVIVGYVPLQFVEYYETELQKYYDKKDNLNFVPRLNVILAIHYTESNFIPSLTSPAFGMPQLTLFTAKDLLDEKYDGQYEQFFSVKGDQVVFDSTKDQVSFTVKFLTEVKKYTREYETVAVRRYIGTGDEAVNYAALVLNRARLYGKMKDGGIDIVRKEFVAEYSKPEVKTVINNQLEIKGYEPLTDGEFKTAIEKAIGVYEYEGTSPDEITLPAIDNGEIKKLPPEHVQFPPIPDDGCKYYIKIEAGRTLYSYFLNIKDMVYTVCDQNKQEAALFYVTKSGKKYLKSSYDIDPTNNKMQANLAPGTQIYLPSGTIIKGDKDTYANLSRVCPE